MQHEQQQLQEEFKNTPVDASQVYCSVNRGLNKDENLSVHDKVLTCNNLDVNLQSGKTEHNLRVYVLNIRKEPLMPCTSAKARHLLRDNKAVVVKRNPFTIKLNSSTGETKQEITFGIDSGYKNIGFSATTEKNELISGEVKLRQDVSKKLTERKMYRILKRNKLWYRQPRFNNRTKSKKKGWLAPSIRHKVDTHIRLVDKIKTLLPITKVTVEVAKFDAQKLQNIDIKGVEYQEGQMKDYDNLRAFVLYRDNYTCQICKKKEGILNIHHIIQRKDGGSDRPNNLATVHKKCHDKFHKGMIKHKFIKPKSFKSTVIMNNIRKYVVNELNCNYTYGYITKRNRIDLGLDKSHVNDAFVIGGGKKQIRSKQIMFIQKRRNNRTLQLNRKGFAPSIRRRRYNIQPKDLVWLNNQVFECSGTHCKGNRIIINKKSVNINLVQNHFARSGIIC